ncbi:type VI secretion system ATPase TssH [Citrobacter rodentium]|uniref:Type VI secretion system ATPase TssH n=1 Tax=Citrobacter rodentium TaxID=67825 RepID=A0A482PKA2_CITRO|nr:type VI secretion system ATPase TssH [Citrobacter rodentium]KIQ49583.1 ATPase AAA [Citrobacter rodentium]QBY29247.1 type VI secretion system ATPase TssH [Citrobacter rodentium]UHO33483.1 type VI secretion system ATPase TssH [Citrobacter rodentium NBRC 105723 = DSM 16636]HAT8012011.1 type VI secretion system ATPase TssH [Citrobacter rodentium NBRC 105723 = DSM 16636]HAT8017062.1 type VI secretion system ATPase TssH [Citrobacter rodentium]
MAITRKNLFGKLNISLFKSVESATTLCKLRGNPYVELVHWLNQIYQQQDSDIRHIVRHFELDAEILERDFAQALTRLPAGASSISDFSYHIELAIERAWIFASLECQNTSIRSGHLLMALLTTMELRRALFSISSVFEKIPLEQLSKDLGYIIRDSAEESEAGGAMVSAEAGVPGEASNAMGGTQSGGLAQYSTDLTALAREGKIDPVLGRDKEINTMIDILLRRRQNNPLLTGEAGVGKTAVVEGLALALAAGEVPPALQKVRLLTLDVTALSAGASMKGEFEARLKAVLEDAAKSVDPVILFIDEVHTLVGAGGNAGTGDAANLMKPMLARGQLRTIGATTWSEFKRHIEKDPALTRRFQVLQVEEPSEDLAIAMLRGLLPVLEKHHGVWVMDEAIRAAVRLSHRYIPARQLPDKAISLLDTACARVAVAQHAPPTELQLLKFHQQSAQAELSMLEKAIGFGKEDDKRLQPIQRAIDDHAEEATALERRWAQECELVATIIDTRQQLLAATVDDPQTPEAEKISYLQSRLNELEATLSEIRGEKALVQTEVNASIVAAIVADWTGIPVGQVLKDDVSAVMELPQRLAEKVIGQTYALTCLSQSIQTARAGLADPQKPFGVFMLVGPSGVGKTETALAIADQLYGGKQNLITINMSEYQEAHTVSSLKGSPPGYVGYGEGGVLTEAVRRKPYSVILLDEVEKAHTDVHELFFQVFDKGSMEDGEGRQIDFRNTVILLTSNAGSDIISSACADPQTMPDEEGLLKLLQPALLKIFPAAFLGRVTVIPYLPLATDSLQHIVRIHLNRIAERAKAQYEMTLNFSDELVQHVVEQCPVAETGARMLIRFIEKNILPKIGSALLTQADKPAKNKTITMQCILSEEKEIDIEMQLEGKQNI